MIRSEKRDCSRTAVDFSRHPHPSVTSAAKFKAKASLHHLTDDFRASIVPIDFAVSGVPSPFLLFSGSLAISIECLVSVLLRPTVFLVIEPSLASCPDVACQAVS